MNRSDEDQAGKRLLRMTEQSATSLTTTILSPSLLATNPYLQAATAHHTRQAYRADLLHFEQSGGMLPATTEAIVAYLQTFATQLNPRTLSRRLTAIKHWHTYQGFADPTRHPLVRKTL